VAEFGGGIRQEKGLAGGLSRRRKVSRKISLSASETRLEGGGIL